MLRLTDAGRAALTDGANRQTQNIQLRSLAIGTGTGPGGAADDSRTTLRTERFRVALAGTTMVSGRIAARGSFTPNAAHTITEAGVFARVGNAGSDFLFAYWVVADASNALATTVSGVELIVAAVFDVTNAPAQVNATVAANITFAGPGTLVALTDTPAQVDADKYLRGNTGATAAVWDQAPPVVATEAALPSASSTVNETYLVRDYNSSGLPALALKDGSSWTYVLTSSALPGLASPAFTGNPTAPTPAAGDNDTSIATTAWVRSRLADLVASAPAALDTLNELAAALGDDANFASTMNAALALRLLTTGGTMTGALNLVTPADGDDSKKAVNSEWVRDLLNREGGMKKKWLYWNGGSTGLEILPADSGTEVVLSESMDSYRLLELHCVWRHNGTADPVALVSAVPFPVPDIPASRGQSGPSISMLRGDNASTYPAVLNMWRTSATTLRMERGTNPFSLRGIIGWAP